MAPPAAVDAAPRALQGRRAARVRRDCRPPRERHGQRRHRVGHLQARPARRAVLWTFLTPYASSGPFVRFLFAKLMLPMFVSALDVLLEVPAPFPATLRSSYTRPALSETSIPQQPHTFRPVCCQLFSDIISAKITSPSCSAPDDGLITHDDRRYCQHTCAITTSSLQRSSLSRESSRQPSFLLS